MSPLTNSVTSTPVSSVSVDSIRALVSKAREGADEALVLGAQALIDVTSPMIETHVEDRESRSAWPSTQGSRGSSATAKSLQRHSAVDVNSNPTSEAGT